MSRLTDPSKIKAATTYNAASDYFDDSACEFWSIYGRKTVEHLHLNLGDRVLDVACGTGASAIPAAEMVGNQGQVIGVDIADNLMALARKKAHRKNLSNLTFQWGDMTNLEFEEDSFDAVICVFAIFFVKEMEEQISKLWRLVRTGGKLAITTWGPNIFAPIYSIWNKDLQQHRPDLFSAFNPWDRITTPEAVQRLLIDGGAKNVEVEAENGFQKLENPEDWWKIAMGSGLRWSIEQMKSDEAQCIRESNLEWIRDRNIDAVETSVIYAVAQKSSNTKSCLDTTLKT